MHYTQPAYSFSSTSAYMSGWQGVYPSANMRYSTCTIQSIPFNECGYPQRQPTPQVHTYQYPYQKPARPSQSTTATSAYGATRARNTPPSPKELRPTESKTQGVLVARPTEQLPVDILTRVLSFFFRTCQLRALSHQYNAAYIQAGPRCQRLHQLPPYVQAYLPPTLCLPHIKAICNSSINVKYSEALQSWQEVLPCAKDENLIAFFENLADRTEFQNSLTTWATAEGRQEELHSNTSKRARCIRDWMGTHQDLLDSVTNMTILGDTFYEWPEEASLLHNLKTVTIQNYCREKILGSIAAMPSVQHIEIRWCEATDMRTSQDWPESILSWTGEKTIRIPDELSHLLPNAQEEKIMESKTDTGTT